MPGPLGPAPQPPDAFDAMPELEELVAEVGATHPMMAHGSAPMGADLDPEDGESPLEPLIFAALLTP
jgi:hypothetical protein